MRKKIEIICLFSSLILLLSAFLSCGKPDKQPADKTFQYDSFINIPGITEDEINTIKKLQNEYNYFVYGMPHSTEAFKNEDGEVRGFTALICEWLTNFIGIPFRPELYEWPDLLNGLASGEISFTGELTATEERELIYHMTKDIASRSLKYYRIAGSRPFEEIAKERLLKCGFIEGTNTINTVISELIPGTFEVVTLSDVSLVYNALKNTEFDVFFYSSTAEANFAGYSDMIASYFYPLIYRPVSLATQNPELEPIISVIEKMLESGGIRYLTSMYNIGQQEYLKHNMNARLTDEERAYIINNPIVLIGAEPNNYPCSFYNKQEKEWQGSLLEILDEISSLTGLTFELTNDEHAALSDIYQMLIDGDIALIPDINHLPEYEERFLWTDPVNMSDHYALISKTEHPNIKINEVLYTKVGLTKNTSYTALFRKWFPNHMNTVEYKNMEEAFDALKRGEIDMVMANQKRLMYMTHYLELPDYKVNVLFDLNIDVKYGLNKDYATLVSIINKALNLIDTKAISDHWIYKTYDYRNKIAAVQRPWLIYAFVLLTCMLVLIWIMFGSRDQEGKRLESLVEDRTAELQRSQLEAERANRAKSSFLSTMSHEIRTPLNAIIGITEIQLQSETLAPKIKEALEKIYSSGDLLLGIINDILDLSKIEAGKFDLLNNKYEITSIIGDTAQLNMMRIGSKNIMFEIDVDENIPAELIGDELRIKQILNNLLSNAFKYTTAGIVKLSITIEPYNKNDGKLILVFTVSDTGQGMTKEQVSKLFDEYSRFNMETNRSMEGTGLGMSIINNLINMMNGSIHVDSEVGKGSVFTVRLPQGLLGDEVLGKEIVANLRQFRTSNRTHMNRVQVIREPMPYGNILIVDDVDTNIYVAKGLLAPYNLKIDTAFSGAETIEKIKSGNVYDIIFMDHMMPNMDGIEATNILRGMGYDQPIVALTANAVAGQAEKFFKNGFTDFISKPIDIRQINAVLNKLVRDKQPKEAIEAARQQDEGITELSDDIGTEPQIDLNLIEIFIRDATKSIAIINDIIEKGVPFSDNDIRTFVVYTHGIKCILTYIGQPELSAFALKLEQAGREKDHEFLLSNTPLFVKLLQIFINMFSPSDNETKEQQ